MDEELEEEKKVEIVISQIKVSPKEIENCDEFPKKYMFGESLFGPCW